jgi:hypothetical protein
MTKIKSYIKAIFNDENDFLFNYIKARIPNYYYKKSIRKKIKKNKYILEYKLSNESIKKIKSFWEEKLGYKIYLDWHKAYFATNGIEDNSYIPEDIFYKIVEPRLNDYSLTKAYSDKNFYSKIFKDFEMPKILLRNIDGKYYDEEYNKINESNAINQILEYSGQKIVIKPSMDTGGGLNVNVINMSDFKKNNLKDYITNIIQESGKDYLIQEYVCQHNLVSEIHPSSLNTLRLVSLRFEGEIHILSRIIRMGNKGSLLDNSTLGGLACGYNSDGKLNSFATEHYSFIKHEFHPYTKVYFKNRIIPNHKLIDDFVKQLHENLYFFDIASWDIAVKEDGTPVFIEVNLRDQDINFHQRNNGPLFAEKTEEVIRYIRTSK